MSPESSPMIAIELRRAASRSCPNGAGCGWPKNLCPSPPYLCTDVRGSISTSRSCQQVCPDRLHSADPENVESQARADANSIRS